MGSLIEELKRREAADRAEADQLRSRMEELARDLARAAKSTVGSQPSSRSSFAGSMR